MKDHNNNGRVDATDTLKNIPEDPKNGLKADYEQTKADMKNVKDKAKDKTADVAEEANPRNWGDGK